MKEKANYKRILISVLLSLISIVLILCFTTTENTFLAIKNMQPLYFFVIIMISFAGITVDSIGIVFFVRGVGEDIRLKDCYKVSMLRIFFNLITPFSFGGQPFIVFVLKKLGVPSGKGSSIVLTRLLIVSFFSFVSGIFSFFFFGEKLASIPVLRYAFLVTAILMIALFVFSLLGLLYPPFIITIGKGLTKLLSKLKIVKNKKMFMGSLIREVVSARNSFKNYFGKHLGFFLGGLLCFGLMFLSQVFVLFFVIRGLGIVMPLMEGLALCSLLLFLIGFMPTPGSSGLGEALFVLIFAKAVPTYLLGLAVILWRTFSQYLSAIVGAILSARIFSRMVVKEQKDDSSAA